MLRLKYLIANCVLALALSLGMNLAWPSYSSASSLYTFTFNESANQNEVVTGYFSIPVSDFSGALANTEFSALTTSAITAISMTEGSQSFGPSELVSDVTLHFNMDNSDVPLGSTPARLIVLAPTPISLLPPPMDAKSQPRAIML